MKIRGKMISVNMLVGLIPVALAIVIFTLAINSQANQSVKSSLSTTLDDLKTKIDNDMESYKSYAYFFARSVTRPTYEGMKEVANYSLSLSVSTYGLKLLETFYSNQNVRSDFYPNESGAFATSRAKADELWKQILKPVNNSTFKMSAPDVFSNILVIRNGAIVMDLTNNEKVGMVLISAIIDSEYLKNLAAKNPDLIVFIETENGFLTGREEMNNENGSKILSSANISNKDYDLVTLNQSRYYFSKTPLFSERAKAGKPGKPIASIGVLYGFASINKIMVVFQRVAVIVLILGIAVAAAIAFFFARTLTNPILSLRDKVKTFESGMVAIPKPAVIQDEINVLQESFSQMTDTIIKNTQELQKANKEIFDLVEQQNGDYYLTSLLIKPLVQNSVQADKIKIEFFMKQKKQFKFKKWEAQLGGDLCIARNIHLQGKKYNVFMNGDAMGKSMQGAGGALVMGVVFNSIIDRTMSFDSEQNKTPHQWLEECHLQLKNIFDSFDGSMTMSLIAGIIDDETGSVYYFNAEHPWLVLYRNGEAKFAEDMTYVSKKLGSPEMAAISIQTFQMLPGDALFIGSDGKDDLMLGMNQDTNQRIINEDETVFLRHVEQSRGVVNDLVATIKEFGDITDDLSLCKISYQG